MDAKTEKTRLGFSTVPEWLAAFPALAAIQDEAWLNALRSAEEIIIPAGTVVVRRGDPCQSFFLIAQGTLRVYESSENGYEIALYRTCGGEPCVLTLSTLLMGGCYAAEARADDEVHAVAISEAQFRSAMSASDSFRNFIMATLARRLNDVMQTVEQVTFQQLDLRLACLLGQLFERNKSSTISMTHEELAHELGTRREVVTRILKDLENAGCIRLGWRHIELVSPKALARQTHSKDM